MPRVFAAERMNMSEVRLNKFLSDAGVCSRREADRAVEAGEVTVNGEPAAMGQKITETDEVTFRGRTVRSIVDQWQNTVKPMHEMYVEPSKKNADIIVPEGGDNPVALDLLIGRIERHFSQNQ